MTKPKSSQDQKIEKILLGPLIKQWQIQDFLLGGADLQRVHFSVKTYAKTKEMDPVGGVCAGGAPLDPPMLNAGSTLEFIAINRQFGPKEHCVGLNHELEKKSPHALKLTLYTWYIIYQHKYY